MESQPLRRKMILKFSSIEMLVPPPGNAWRMKMIRRFLTRVTPMLGAAALLLAPAAIEAQFGRHPRLRPAKQIAPEDLTGYWVSIVTEDWRWRMVTPAKGDFTSVPLNQEGRKVAEAWDPDKDTAAGNQCQAYGAAGLMREPTRVHITWVDDNTLKVETDAGTQTRLFHFKRGMHAGALKPRAGRATLEPPGTDSGRAPRGGGNAPRGGSLKVVTTDLKPGYLRKNGLPYSGNTVLTEYYDRTNEPNGDSWLIITTIVHDPENLYRGFRHQHALQDGEGRIQVGSDALRTK